ncbi:MAG: ABC transporter substrate-binding protein [Clostridiales bacterium]|jgi:peptide/nickel transport system substrate-binding protein|nr:ABC transporter substrate-binding protein [Clostridiales bacterium]
MKKILAVVFVIAMLLSLAACGDKAPTPTATPGTPDGTPAPTERPVQTLNVAHKANPTSLFAPTVANVSANGPVHCFLYDTLVSYDIETDGFNPSIAEKWEYVDDTHIKFTLRKDVFAHDGSQIKASDVLYTFKLADEYGKNANYYGRLDLDDSSVVDEYTIILATKAPDPYLFYTLANTALAISSESAIKSSASPEDQNKKPIAGSGPYKFVEWIDGASIKLERNENYWGGTPYFDFVEIKIITDASARIMNLESKDVDVALDPVISQAKTLEGRPEFTVANIETKTYNLMFLNCVNFAPFTDVKVRQAVALALDYEMNTEIGTDGYGYVTDSLIPNANPAYAAPDGSYENCFRYDVEAAKAKLAESSYPNGFTVKLKYMENAMFPKLAQLVQNQLKEIGITVELLPTASSVFYTDAAEGNFDIYLASPSNPDPGVALNYYDGRVGFQKAAGGTGWRGPEELDELIDLAKSTIDDAERNGYYKKIQAIINENVPAISLCSQNRVFAHASDIDGIRYTPFSDVDLSHAFRK